MLFLPETLRVEPIRVSQAYGGYRVLLQATLGTARLKIQVDVGFGDVVTPVAQLIAFPTLLDQPAPYIRAYSRETVVAEKFQAMVYLGMVNSRMKDFYDLWILANQCAFKGPVLASAIQATFIRRKTPLPTDPPLALTEEFYADKGKIAEWNGFLRRSKLQKLDVKLADVVEELQTFLLPLLLALHTRATFTFEWHEGGPWEAHE